jgi:hypothetical protein
MVKKSKKPRVVVRDALALDSEVQAIREREPVKSLRQWLKAEALRRAEVAFITDEQQRPLEYWWQRICSETVTLRAFQMRADKGKWAPRRERYWEAVVQEVLRKSKHRAVHDRVHELQEIQAVRDNVLEMVQPEIVGGRKFYKVQPNSFEGMINALVKLDALTDAKRDAVLAMIEPDLAREELGEERTLFAHDEMETLAQGLLEMRMLKQQKRLEAHRREESDDEDQD